MKRSAATWTTLAQQYVMDDTNVPAGTTNSPGTVNMLLGFTAPVHNHARNDGHR